MAVKTPKAAMRVGIFMGTLVGFLVAGNVRLGQDKDDGRQARAHPDAGKLPRRPAVGGITDWQSADHAAWVI